MATLLYVEDYESMRLFAQEFLTGKGHNIYLAADGLEGLDVLKRVDGIQIIFTDCNMPRMNGVRFIKEVKANPDYARYSNIPIVGVGTFPEGNRTQLVECLEKPFGSQELLRCIDQYCRK